MVVVFIRTSIRQNECEVLVAQSCLTLCDPMDCSPPGSSAHGLFQATLEWAAIPFSRGSSRPMDWTWVSCIAGRFFTIWATREDLLGTIMNPQHIHILISRMCEKLCGCDAVKDFEMGDYPDGLNAITRIHVSMHWKGQNQRRCEVEAGVMQLLAVKMEEGQEPRDVGSP